MTNETSQDKQTALVLGATGGIGGALTKVLLARGWTVRALHRSRSGLDESGICWIKGDALEKADVIAAAEGASIIVHAVNPPGYRNWAQLVVPMIDASIAAARLSGARILLPGTVYNYGPDVFPLIAEDAPQNPRTRKGAIRVQLEQRLEAAAQDGVKVLIVRAGDFFGPGTGNNWFSQGLVKPGQRPSTVTYPGKTGVGHQWAFLPDLAETMMQLIEQQDRLPGFARFHFGGHFDHDGTQMVASIAKSGQNPVEKPKNFPWLLIGLLQPFVPLFRELFEMRYLWQQPVCLDNAQLMAFLGSEPHTPLDRAVEATLRAQGSV